MLDVLSRNLGIPTVEDLTNMVLDLARSLRAAKALQVNTTKRFFEGKSAKSPVSYRSPPLKGGELLFRPFCAELTVALAPGKCRVYARAEKSIQKLNSNGKFADTTWVEDTTLIHQFLSGTSRKFTPYFETGVVVSYALVVTAERRHPMAKARELAILLHRQVEDGMASNPMLEAELCSPRPERLLSAAIELIRFAHSKARMNDGTDQATLGLRYSVSHFSLYLKVWDQLRQAHQWFQGSYDVNGHIVTSFVSDLDLGQSQMAHKHFKFDKIRKRMDEDPGELENILGGLVDVSASNFTNAIREADPPSNALGGKDRVFSVAKHLIAELYIARELFEDQPNRNFNKVAKGMSNTGFQLALFFTKSGALAYTFGYFRRSRSNRNYYYPETFITLRSGWLNAERKTAEECQPSHVELVYLPANAIKSRNSKGTSWRLQEWAIIHFLQKGDKVPGVRLDQVTETTTKEELKEENEGTKWLERYRPSNQEGAGTSLEFVLPPGVYGSSRTSKTMFVDRGYKP